MRYLIAILIYCCFFIFPSQAQQPLNDSASKAIRNDLNLTKEQKHAIKQLIVEFKLEDRKRRRLLRHRIFMQLNIQQQMAIRKMWRKQLGN
jgi:hypothetical protein